MAPQESLTAIEFFSGIGGMHYALREAVPPARVVAAFDICPAAVRCYRANFPTTPCFQKSVESVSTRQLDTLAARLWLLAPPCQPYTRQGKEKDVEDGRAVGFLRLLDRISQMSHPPGWVILENVVGFERSTTRARFVETLAALGFQHQEFQLSPLDYGIPYARPRYFCLARRDPFPVQKLFSMPWTCSASTLISLRRGGTAALASSPPEVRGQVKTISCYLEAPQTIAETSHSAANGPIKQQANTPAPSSHATVATASAEHPRAEGAGCDSSCAGHPSGSEGAWDAFYVPRSALSASNAECIDVVTPCMHNVNCFTKAYTQYVKGTGSVLATCEFRILNTFTNWGLREEGGPPVFVDDTVSSDSQAVAAAPTSPIAAPPAEEPQGRTDLIESMAKLRLRYFTPREVANLHSFPESFSFPDDVALRQRYALLGNSLSVAVVSDLLRYLFFTDS